MHSPGETRRGDGGAVLSRLPRPALLSAEARLRAKADAGRGRGDFKALRAWLFEIQSMTWTRPAAFA